MYQTYQIEIIWLVAALVGGIFAGGVIIWLMSRSRISLMNERLAMAQQDLVNAYTELEQKGEKIVELNQLIARLETTLEHERKAANEKTAILNEATARL